MSSMPPVTNNFIIPTVIEQTHRGERGWDIFSRLLKDRIIFLGSAVDDLVANIVIAQLLFSKARTPTRTSCSHQFARRHGDCGHGHLRHHAIRAAWTWPPSAWARPLRWALSLGRRGQGQAVRPASLAILIHQPLGGFSGQATDVDIHAREILRTRDQFERAAVKHTGQPMERIKHDTERDYFMSRRAKDTAIVDEVIAHKNLPKVSRPEAASGARVAWARA